jgi:peroxygenase
MNNSTASSTLPFDHTVPNCPATSERQQATGSDAFLEKPGIARANLAVSAEVPDGSPTSKGAAMRDYVRFSISLFPHLVSVLCLW